MATHENQAFLHGCSWVLMGIHGWSWALPKSPMPWTHLEEQRVRVALSDGEGTLPPPAGAAEQVSAAVWDHNPLAAPDT